MINKIINNYCLEKINAPLSSLSSSSLSSLAKKGLTQKNLESCILEEFFHTQMEDLF